jgi:nucleoid DNA-binding protein
MIINKNKLINKIYNKIGKAVYKIYINDIINIVCDYISDEIVQDRTFSVRNFGTFSPYRYRGHKAYDVTTGIVRDLSSTNSVKFRSHVGFCKLIKRKKTEFEFGRNHYMGKNVRRKPIRKKSFNVP